MTDYYLLMRETLLEAAAAATPPGCKISARFSPGDNYPLSLSVHSSDTPDKIPPKLLSALQQNGPTLLGAPMLLACTVRGARLLCQLSDECYDAMLLSVLEFPQADRPNMQQGAGAYAAQRLRMLLRTVRLNPRCPKERPARAALLYALGIPGALDNPRLLKLRLDKTAAAALNMLRCVPPHSRRIWHHHISGIMFACERLLSLGLQTLPIDNLKK